jgi:mRNA-degrading endonuclease toxin of MazEF toxin-antitoxin module
MGERPAILIQHDHLTAQLPTVLIVPLTGTQSTTRFPGTLLIQPDGQNGLTIPSVALAFQARVLDKNDVIHHLGKLDPAVLDQVIGLLVSFIR